MSTESTEGGPFVEVKAEIDDDEDAAPPNPNMPDIGDLDELTNRVKVEASQDPLRIITEDQSSNCLTSKRKYEKEQIELEVSKKSKPCDTNEFHETLEQCKTESKKYNNSNTYQCPECPYNTKLQKNLKKHYKNHLTNLGEKCSYCTFRSRTILGVKSHEYLHVKSGPACRLCPVVPKSNTLKRHKLLLRKILPDKVQQINQVEIKREIPSPESKTSGNKHHINQSYVEEEESRIDAKDEQTYSNSCNLEVSRSSYFVGDSRGNSWFRCTSRGCPYKTNTLYSLKQHRVNHNAKSPLRCRYCSFSCKSNGVLTVHLLQHVEAQNSSRQDVGSARNVIYKHPRKLKYLKYDKKLRQHYYQCPECPSKHSLRKNFVAHYKKHSATVGEKCRHCTFRGTKREMRQHIILIHASRKSLKTKATFKHHMQPKAAKNYGKTYNQTITNSRDIYYSVEHPETEDDDIMAVVLKETSAKNHNDYSSIDIVNRLRRPSTDPLTRHLNDSEEESEDDIKAVIMDGKCILNTDVEEVSCSDEEESDKDPLGDENNIQEPQYDRNRRITITITTSKESNDTDFIKTALVAEILKSFELSGSCQAKQNELEENIDCQATTSNFSNGETAVVADILKSFHIPNEEEEHNGENQPLNESAGVLKPFDTPNEETSHESLSERHNDNTMEVVWVPSHVNEENEGFNEVDTQESLETRPGDGPVQDALYQESENVFDDSECNETSIEVELQQSFAKCRISEPEAPAVNPETNIENNSEEEEESCSRSNEPNEKSTEINMPESLENCRDGGTLKIAVDQDNNNKTSSNEEEEPCSSAETNDKESDKIHMQDSLETHHYEIDQRIKVVKSISSSNEEEQSCSRSNEYETNDKSTEIIDMQESVEIAVDRDTNFGNSSNEEGEKDMNLGDESFEDSELMRTAADSKEKEESCKPNDDETNNIEIHENQHNGQSIKAAVGQETIKSVDSSNEEEQSFNRSNENETNEKSTEIDVPESFESTSILNRSNEEDESCSRSNVTEVSVQKSVGYWPIKTAVDPETNIGNSCNEEEQSCSRSNEESVENCQDGLSVKMTVDREINIADSSNEEEQSCSREANEKPDEIDMQGSFENHQGGGPKEIAVDPEANIVNSSNEEEGPCSSSNEENKKVHEVNMVDSWVEYTSLKTDLDPKTNIGSGRSNENSKEIDMQEPVEHAQDGLLVKMAVDHEINIVDDSNEEEQSCSRSNDQETNEKSHEIDMQGPLENRQDGESEEIALDPEANTVNGSNEQEGAYSSSNITEINKKPLENDMVISWVEYAPLKNALLVDSCNKQEESSSTSNDIEENKNSNEIDMQESLEYGPDKTIDEFQQVDIANEEESTFELNDNGDYKTSNEINNVQESFENCYDREQAKTAVAQATDIIVTVQSSNIAEEYSSSNLNEDIMNMEVCFEDYNTCDDGGPNNNAVIAHHISTSPRIYIIDEQIYRSFNVNEENNTNLSEVNNIQEPSVEDEEEVTSSNNNGKLYYADNIQEAPNCDELPIAKEITESCNLSNEISSQQQLNLESAESLDDDNNLQKSPESPQSVANNNFKREMMECVDDDCPFITFSVHNLKQHLAFHEGKGLLRCRYCSFRSNGQSSLRQHLLQHMEKQSDAGTYTSEIERYEGSSPRKMYLCQYCDYLSGSLYYMKEHLQIHKKKTNRNLSQGMRCPLCSFKADLGTNNMMLHLQDHVVQDNGWFRCPLCKRTKHSEKSAILSHIRLIHRSRFEVAKYNSRNKASSSSQSEEDEDSECDESTEVQIAEGAMGYNEQEHERERAYSEHATNGAIVDKVLEINEERVETVHESCRIKEQVANHEIQEKVLPKPKNNNETIKLEHTNSLKNPNFQCMFCPTKMSNERAFVCHLRLHSDRTGGVQCPLCTYRHNKTDLLRHVLCHVIESDGVFRCPLCEAEKRNMENMADHLKVVHSRPIFREHESVCKKKFCNGYC